MHGFVTILETPVIIALFGLLIFSIWEIGLTVGESMNKNLISLKAEDIIKKAKKRIATADFIARIGPMLGLMGTLIPLGPGLAALSAGEFETLSKAVITAFDTTVLGLIIGGIGFTLGKYRKQLYEKLLNRLEKSKL